MTIKTDTFERPNREFRLVDWEGCSLRVRPMENEGMNLCASITAGYGECKVYVDVTKTEALRLSLVFAELAGS